MNIRCTGPFLGSGFPLLSLFCLIAFLVLSFSPARSQAVDLQQYGRAYLAEGDSAAAIQSYGELVRQNPFDPVALNNLATAKAAAGDYQAALDLLTRAVRLAPQRADIRDNLKQLEAWQKKNHSVTLNSNTGNGNNANNAGKPPVAKAAVPGNRTAVLPEPPALWSAIPSTASGPSAGIPAMRTK
jgi:tetratricopeptide (TPR) repeat protein